MNLEVCFMGLEVNAGEIHNFLVMTRGTGPGVQVSRCGPLVQYGVVCHI